MTIDRCAYELDIEWFKANCPALSELSGMDLENAEEAFAELVAKLVLDGMDETEARCFALAEFGGEE